MPTSVAVEVPSSHWVAVNDSVPAKRVKPAGKAASAAKGSAPEATPAAAAAPALSESATAGRVQFNNRCSHCHGTDGYSPVRERDVRYLKTRYSDKWQETTLLTVRDGRPDAGMPAWKDSLKEADVQQIVSFLTSIQK